MRAIMAKGTVPSTTDGNIRSAHGIYWPIMLHALGFPDEQMPKFLVHGWWNISGAKMSKSLGNVIDPDQLADKYGAEALRYYLMSDIVTGKDSDFSEERIVTRYNTDLANVFGNLLNRTLNMVGRYREGIVTIRNLDELYSSLEKVVPGTAPTIIVLATKLALGRAALENYCELLVRQGKTLLDEGSISELMLFLFASISDFNRRIEEEAPWRLAKNAERSSDLDAVLYHLAESLRIIAILISPVLPKAAHGIFEQLNWKMEPELSGKETRLSLADAAWGKLPDGHVVGKPTPLFPRIEVSAPPK